MNTSVFDWLICVVVLQNFTVDPCGPVHITMGDGGNIEGVCEFPVLLLSLLLSTVTVGTPAVLQHGLFARFWLTHGVDKIYA